MPAINIRGLTYDTARAMFRAARRLDTGAIMFEIAKSEIGYTDQRPAEYVADIIAAAIREGHHGPVFIQGDHFQFNAKKYAADPEKETAGVRALTKESIAAGFYNIDVDTSTLVDLSSRRSTSSSATTTSAAPSSPRSSASSSRAASRSRSAARSARSASRTRPSRSSRPTWTATCASWRSTART